MMTPSHRYVPTHCPRCLRAFLIPLHAGAEVSCSNCGGLAHVVPGEVYRAEDAILFGKIETAFDSANLPLSDTFRVVAELGNVIERTRSPHTLLLRMLLPLPGLRFLESTQPEEQERLVRAMGMLLAIAAARARHGLEVPRAVRARESLNESLIGCEGHACEECSGDGGPVPAPPASTTGPGARC